MLDTSIYYYIRDLGEKRIYCATIGASVNAKGYLLQLPAYRIWGILIWSCDDLRRLGDISDECAYKWGCEISFHTLVKVLCAFGSVRAP